MNIVQPGQPAPPAPGALTLAAAAARAGCCTKTLRRAIRAGRLPAEYGPSPRGARWLVAPAALDAWGARRTRRAAGAHGNGVGPARDPLLPGAGPAGGAAGTGTPRDRLWAALWHAADLLAVTQRRLEDLAATADGLGMRADTRAVTGRAPATASTRPRRAAESAEGGAADARSAGSTD